MYHSNYEEDYIRPEMHGVKSFRPWIDERIFKLIGLLQKCSKHPEVNTLNIRSLTKEIHLLNKIREVIK